MYRQPLDGIAVQHCLVLMFAVNQVLRLVLVVGSGQFSLESAALSACAVPAVYLVTGLHHRYPPTMSLATARRILSGRLTMAGGSLIASAVASGKL